MNIAELIKVARLHRPWQKVLLVRHLHPTDWIRAKTVVRVVVKKVAVGSLVLIGDVILMGFEVIVLTGPTHIFKARKVAIWTHLALQLVRSLYIDALVETGIRVRACHLHGLLLDFALTFHPFVLVFEHADILLELVALTVDVAQLLLTLFELVQQFKHFLRLQIELFLQLGTVFPELRELANFIVFFQNHSVPVRQILLQVINRLFLKLQKPFFLLQNVFQVILFGL